MAQVSWRKNIGHWQVWGLSVCLVLACLLSSVWFWQYQRDHVSERVSETSYQTKQGKERLKACGPMVSQRGVVEWLSCFNDAVTANISASTGHYDLKAQQDMAEWGLGTMLITLLTFLVGIVGVIFVKKTLDQNSAATKAATSAAEAANEANRILRAEQRPWVTLRWTVECEVEDRGRTCNIKWNYDFENMGNSPAHNVWLDWEIYRFDWARVGAGQAGVHDITRRAKQRHPVASPKTLFPREKTEFLRHDDWNGGMTVYGEDAGQLFLCVCLIYSLDPLNTSVGCEARALVMTPPGEESPTSWRLLDIPGYAATE